MNGILRGFASAAALFVSFTSAHASNIATIEAQPVNTAGLILDSSPVITAILSQPGVLNGRTYTNWSFLVSDGTGAIEIFGSGAAFSGFGYTPAVGDIITATGSYVPYHEIPALSTLTAVSVISSGNAVPDPLVRTVADLNHAPMPLSIGGYVIDLNNATIAGQGSTFGTTDGPFGATVTDASGTMTFWYWPSSQSSANSNLFGQAVPTGPVNMRGIVSVYSGTAEFHPLSIVPEPSAMVMLAAGGLVILRRRRR